MKRQCLNDNKKSSKQNAAKRLPNKSALKQEPEGKRFLYSPLVTRDECVEREGESFLDRAMGRIGSAAVLNLVEKAELSPEDIRELRKILREKDK